MSSSEILQLRALALPRGEGKHCGVRGTADFTVWVILPDPFSGGSALGSLHSQRLYLRRRVH